MLIKGPLMCFRVLLIKRFFRLITTSFVIIPKKFAHLHERRAFRSNFA